MRDIEFKWQLQLIEGNATLTAANAKLDALERERNETQVALRLAGFNITEHLDRVIKLKAVNTTLVAALKSLPDPCGGVGGFEGEPEQVGDDEWVQTQYECQRCAALAAAKETT